MIDYGILYLDSHNIVSIKSVSKFSLLGYYFVNGTIPYYWLANNEEKEIIDDMISKEQAYFETTLLDKKEYEYFDYFLSSRFGDAEELRNKYAHGSANSLTESQHKMNYYRILFLFFLLTIKINEEFDYNINSFNYENYANYFLIFDFNNLIKHLNTN